MSESSEGIHVEESGRGWAVEDTSDSGRRIVARIFGGISVFMVLIATVYWFVSYEAAGTTFLLVAAGMTGLPAAYMGWPRNRGGPPSSAQDPEPGHDPHDGVWFPEASIWPLAIGGSMVLFANGLLLGRWLSVPAVVLLAWSILGMIRQGRHRM